MEAMTRLNAAVGFYEPMDLVDIWQQLDQEMRGYWDEKKQERERRKKEMEGAQQKQA
jgi:hypothetical protein